MKRFIVGLCLILLTTSLVAQSIRNKWNERINISDDEALLIKYVAGGTETATSVHITRSSITLIVTDGFQPGTTGWDWSNTATDTLTEFESYIEARDSSSTVVYQAVPCFEGEWQITLNTFTHTAQPTESLTDAKVDVFGITNHFDVTQASWTYFKYDITDHTGKTTYVTNFISSMTISGDCFIGFRDSAGTLNGPLLHVNNVQDTVTDGHKMFPGVGNDIPLIGGTSLDLRCEGKDISDYFLGGWIWLFGIRE